MEELLSGRVETPEIVRLLEALNRRFAAAGDAESAIVLDDEWHLELIAACPNRVLIELIENIIPLGQRCSILELSEEKCHWPIGDPGTPEFFFCGGRSIDGLPYCGYHSRIAYQPVSERRREKRAARE